MAALKACVADTRHSMKVPRLRLEKIGAKLTVLSDKQAGYIGVSKDGPYKPDTYRY